MVEEDGVSGGTSNPSIFEKAIAAGDHYSAGLQRLALAGCDAATIYDELTIADIRESCDVFLPVYEATEGRDGFASLEVSPHLAYDTEATIREAIRLFRALDRPNAMIKIPGTAEGLPAIERCLYEGVNVNITLLFGVDNYEQVAWTYVSALERRAAEGKPIDRIASVASFFVSRVDTMVDERLTALIAASGGATHRRYLENMLGKAGIANAKIAYAKFKEVVASPRWRALAEKGARVQRCLWASTSTKNPAYRDVMYVEGLIGPDTVNTLPQSTLDAFRDHGVVAPTLEANVESAFAHIRQLEAEGIDFKAVTDELQRQGVKLFCDSFDQAMATIERRRQELLAGQRAGRPS
jgi:transaldolase